MEGRSICQSGSCSCRNGGQGRIKTFQKKCICSKLKNLGKPQNIQVFEKLCRHRPQTYLKKHFETIRKHPSGKDMEIQGPVPRETDSSPFRVFQWFLRPSTSISHVPQRLGYVKSWLVDKEIGKSLNIMISTLVPSITNQVLFSWRN